MNKRGQFFLIGAIIFIGVMVSLATVVNTVRTSAEQDSFYRRAGEVGYESKRVLDYGVYESTGTIENDLESFLEEYADYIGQEQVLFLFGDETNITGYTFKQTGIGSVTINTGSTTAGVEVQAITNTLANVTVDGNDISVAIEDTTYEFTLREGQNFFFVIIKTVEEERYVAQG